MHLSNDQYYRDRRAMKDFIAQRIPEEGTRIILADGEGGEIWADLCPIWDEQDGWDLYFETNCREAIGLPEIHDHFRRQEMTVEKWQGELVGTMARWNAGGCDENLDAPDGRPPRKGKKEVSSTLLKPMDIKREARVPYETVIQWIITGHPRAGVLPSIDLSITRKRHSFRIRQEDWDAFRAKLQTIPRSRQRSTPPPRPTLAATGMFRY